MNYLLAFRRNPLRTIEYKAYEASLLIVLEALIGRIGPLTEDQTFSKKRKKLSSAVFDFELGERAQPRTSSVPSDSLTKTYEVSMVEIFSSLEVAALDAEQTRSYVHSLREFSTSLPFKFEKQTITVLLELCLSLLNNLRGDPVPLLATIGSLLGKLPLETSTDLLSALLKTILLFELSRSDYDSSLKQSTKELLAVYEGLLHESRYIHIYDVLLDILEDELEKSQQASKVLFRLGFHHRVLLVLLEAATEAARAGWDAAKYPKLKTRQNRNTLFKLVLAYLAWGYTSKKELLLMPLHELCQCLISNCCVPNMHVFEWLGSLIAFMKESQLPPYSLFK